VAATGRSPVGELGVRPSLRALLVLSGRGSPRARGLVAAEAAPSASLQDSRVDADYCCSADSGASGMTAARGGGATLWLSAPPHRVAQLARAGFRIAVRMQRCYAAR